MAIAPYRTSTDLFRPFFENGVLSVTVPKSERARRRKIEVQHDQRSQQQIPTGGTAS